MHHYIIKRIITALLIIFGVLTLTFVLMHLAPGDPTSIYIKPEIDPATVESIRHQLGLDQPLWRQYFLWIREFCLLNFGVSFTHSRPVRQILFEAMGNTLQLTVIVFIFQFIIGIGIGIMTALRENSKFDHGTHASLLFFNSFPSFWLALIAITIFSLKLGWLPSSQMKSITIDGGTMAVFIDRLKHLILPVIMLSIPFITYTSRYVRGNMLLVLNQNYIRTARAYGLPSHVIILRYALKNALLPLVTLTGLYLPFLLGGAVVTESIFAWPGMGRLTVNAILAHDFPLILASNFIAALTVVIGNLIADILYTVVDPRIRLQQ